MKRSIVSINIKFIYFKYAVVFLLLLFTLSAVNSSFASLQEGGKTSAEDFKKKKYKGTKVYSPYVGRDYPDQVLMRD
jgi:hypothetical protein